MTDKRHGVAYTRDGTPLAETITWMRGEDGQDATFATREEALEACDRDGWRGYVREYPTVPAGVEIVPLSAEQKAALSTDGARLPPRMAGELSDIVDAIRARRESVSRLRTYLGEALGRHARAGEALAAAVNTSAETIADEQAARIDLELAAGDKREALADFFDACAAGSGIIEADERVRRAMDVASERHRALRAARSPAFEEARKECLRAEREVRHVEECLAQETSLLDLDLAVFHSTWAESQKPIEDKS